MMFGIGDEITFTYDEFRRLRISVPEELLPLAAFLHTDVQPNIAAMDDFAGFVRLAQAEQRTWLGNGCALDLVNDVVLLESLYDRWPRLTIPASLFWPVLEGLRGFLISSAQAPRLQRPAGYPAVTRATTEFNHPDSGRVSYVDHTYFPRTWTREDVIRAGEGAWQSPQLVTDEKTGAWSGMWGNLELAGYHDPATGQALTYFPVLF
ncbi:EndoU domain-containing protein [Amycolatopsis suaedae]|uniref:Uncharacterized protein n=1 Tax=Amycolatopsis suaedae TaxID=2510978 RepID=A0A4Q7J5B7_9PSEU|nr:EndoU domain-containing protein [Amycolatopsis suaedae]RZQ61926.1 hypothetical protein EWH70_20125 [Amycolatopsis suaedae]